MPEWLKLAGILIVLVGFALKLRTTIVVVTAAILTGMIAGLPLFTLGEREGIVNMLGRAFADNRLMTLFLVTLPAIGLSERHGLQERSAAWIRRIRTATVGRLCILYQQFRILHGILGLRLIGHASFVRPLIFPMSAGAAAKSEKEVPPEKLEIIKAANSASENYGNFYGQNLSIVQPGILLVYGVMNGLGYDVSLLRLILFTIPVVLLSVILGSIQFLRLDQHLQNPKNEVHR
jgi:uncharacterized membrane protein